MKKMNAFFNELFETHFKPWQTLLIVTLYVGLLLTVVYLLNVRMVNPWI